MTILGVRTSGKEDSDKVSTYFVDRWIEERAKGLASKYAYCINVESNGIDKKSGIEFDKLAKAFANLVSHLVKDIARSFNVADVWGEEEHFVKIYNNTKSNLMYDAGKMVRVGESKIFTIVEFFMAFNKLYFYIKDSRVRVEVLKHEPEIDGEKKLLVDEEMTAVLMGLVEPKTK